MIFIYINLNTTNFIYKCDISPALVSPIYINRLIFHNSNDVVLRFWTHRIADSLNVLSNLEESIVDCILCVLLIIEYFISNMQPSGIFERRLPLWQNGSKR